MQILLNNKIMLTLRILNGCSLLTPILLVAIIFNSLLIEDKFRSAQMETLLQFDKYNKFIFKYVHANYLRLCVLQTALHFASSFLQPYSIACKLQFAVCKHGLL
ncbi:hypothetical protein Pint_10994 [Pistacia integerrima]|uniref:Uncharacterized protein n=1 Tax=Pistacia integerrima TaxID=434235 RepID=A0ACC0XEM8_9ROSI|nr:hypothetical protein Pint_10994 [Pistacia integerrima]